MSSLIEIVNSTIAEKLQSPVTFDNDNIFELVINNSSEVIVKGYLILSVHLDVINDPDNYLHCFVVGNNGNENELSHLQVWYSIIKDSDVDNLKHMRDTYQAMINSNRFFVLNKNDVDQSNFQRFCEISANPRDIIILGE